MSHKPVSLYEAHFNALPRIRKSDSQRFAAAAKEAIATALPRWREYAVRPDAGDGDGDGEGAEDDVDPDDLPPTERWLMMNDHRHSKDDYVSQIKKTQRVTGKTPAELETLVGALAKRIRVHTNADLAERLKRAAEWLESNIAGERWVALTERLEKGDEMKSTEWALSVAWKYLATKPWCVADIASSKRTGGAAALADFYARGVRHYALFDDAAYSGVQKSSQVFSSALRFLREAADTAGATAKDDPVTVYVAIPFFTNSAMKTFAERAATNGGVRVSSDPGSDAYAFPGGHRVLVWTGGSLMPSLAEILRDEPSFGLDPEAAHQVHKILFGEAGSLCIFQHKIPDYLSLPWMYGATFQRAMKDHYARMPPYNPAAPPTSARSSPRSSPEAPKTFECFAGASGGAAEKMKFNGRLYAIRTGARGGRYITLAGAKRYV